MSVFAMPAYRRLFSAQMIALFGTGLATVALGLLAYDLAGRNAGAVLGTALTTRALSASQVAYTMESPRVRSRRVSLSEQGVSPDRGECGVPNQV
jgi:hypothetical protein